MKFTKLDLLTMLISLFLFSSCKDASTVGLDVDGNTAIQGTLLDTVTIKTQTLQDVNIATYFPASAAGLPRYPLGEMNDDVFGKTTASLAMSVNLPSSSSYDFGTNAVIDSAVLILPYSFIAATTASSRINQFYGDSTATYNVTVNQLTSNLATTTSFLSNKEYAAGTQLGAFSGKIKPNTYIKTKDIIAGAEDTLVTHQPQLRIRLDNELIKSKIMSLDSASLSTNARFAISFKGLKVSASVASGKGGMMFFNLSTADSASVAIYYKNQNATTATVTDTLVAKFQILTTANPVAATVKHDYSGTDVESQLKNPATEYQTTYLQAMSGVRNKISFPYLKDLTAKIGSKILINKAQLVIDINNDADSIPFKIPKRLTLYGTDIAGSRIKIADNNPYSSTNTSGDIRVYNSGIAFLGGYNTTQKTYVFNVTNHIQDIIDGKIIDYGTYLAPTDDTDDGYDLFPYPVSAGRAVIGSFNNTDNRKIRLNIYYVKVAQ